MKFKVDGLLQDGTAAGEKRYTVRCSGLHLLFVAVSLAMAWYKKLQADVRQARSGAVKRRYLCQSSSAAVLLGHLRRHVVVQSIWGEL